MRCIGGSSSAAVRATAHCNLDEVAGAHADIQLGRFDAWY